MLLSLTSTITAFQIFTRTKHLLSKLLLYRLNNKYILKLWNYLTFKVVITPANIFVFCKTVERKLHFILYYTSNIVIYMYTGIHVALQMTNPPISLPTKKRLSKTSTTKIFIYTYTQIN